MGLRDKRVNYKPFEYQELLIPVENMRSQYWVHKERSFSQDVQDFNVKLTKAQQTVVLRTFLSISQTEVAVKPFWGDIYRDFPKPEVNGLGVSIAECEFRHSETYAAIIDALGLTEMFKTALDIPIFQRKVAFINKYLTPETSAIDKLVFFTIVIENSILFSQFAVGLSFNRFKGGIMSVIANMLKWTTVDEQWHAIAGIQLLNILQREGEVLDYKKISNIIKDSIEFESEFLDWIFEEGELEFFSKENLIDYAKHRADSALGNLNLPTIFDISKERLKPMEWFEIEVFGSSYDDFFAKRVTDYTKDNVTITRGDLFRKK